MEPIEPFPWRSVCTVGDKRDAESQLPKKTPRKAGLRAERVAGMPSRLAPNTPQPTLVPARSPSTDLLCGDGISAGPSQCLHHKLRFDWGPAAAMSITIAGALPVVRHGSEQDQIEQIGEHHGHQQIGHHRLDSLRHLGRYAPESMKSRAWSSPALFKLSAVLDNSDLLAHRMRPLADVRPLFSCLSSGRFGIKRLCYRVRQDHSIRNGVDDVAAISYSAKGGPAMHLFLLAIRRPRGA
jgi:hypothetical protein